jgi:hypothetical protein
MATETEAGAEAEAGAGAEAGAEADDDDDMDDEDCATDGRASQLVRAAAVSPCALTRRPRPAPSTPVAAPSAPDADEAETLPPWMRRAESDEP